MHQLNKTKTKVKTTTTTTKRKKERKDDNEVFETPVNTGCTVTSQSQPIYTYIHTRTVEALDKVDGNVQSTLKKKKKKKISKEN